MPSRNVVKSYDVDSVYHIYNRGVEKRTIFLDEDDYRFFEYLLERHLGIQQMKDKMGRDIPNYSEEVELLAYCLVPNHFHLMIYQHDRGGMVALMRSLATAYTRYFNAKYIRVGSLFQGIYKASKIEDDSYYQHLSRYIHLNADDVSDALIYPYSSVGDYLVGAGRPWIKTDRILSMFTDVHDYKRFMNDYEGHRNDLKEMKRMLADN